ncbi:hypothetical protein MYAM1_002395 [Malassezia yamatoensis]|uniref:Uncharacterized protein n=1 Tax=Malassezia yamatoensis TaxID=253288 RepID=A0AAJ5YUF4_9BASI|nr:hypothetical protein MYAM1_002395 [Malassezia yamatoensis]
MSDQQPKQDFNPMEFLAKQSKNLKTKYQQNLENYERNTGQSHSLSSGQGQKDGEMHTESSSSTEKSK